MIERISIYSRPFAGSKVFFTKIYICHSIIASEQLERGFFHIHQDNIQTWNNA